MSDYRWWLSGDPLPPETLAAVAYGIHANGAEKCDCESAQEHNYLLESYGDIAVYALESAAPLIADAERARILSLLDSWHCSCGETDCGAYDARDEIASMITEAGR